MAEDDLSRLNGKQEAQTFTKQNFTGKILKNIKFSNISFIDCDFTGAQIRGCEFNAVHSPDEKSTFKKCIFTRCKFNGTKFFNVKFNEAIIEECTFENNVFNDVLVDGDSTFKDNEFIGEKFQVNNFMIRGQKIDDVTKLTSVVEQINEQVEVTSDDPNVEVKVQTEDEKINEEDYDNEEAMKLYNVLFPQILKQYPAFIKDVDENGNEVWTVVIDNIEACVCADEEYNVWRIMFSILRKDAEFGGDYLGGGELTCGLPNKEITLDALKEVFENVAKSSAEEVAKQTNSQVVKNALNKFVQVVFNVITQSLFGNKGGVVINYSTNPEDVTGVLNSGYDFKTKTPVIIIGKPFVTDNSAESNRVRTLIANGLKFIFGQDDIRNMGLEELTAYAKDHPYSCFVYESNSYYNGRASVRDFGPNDVVILK